MITIIILAKVIGTDPNTDLALIKDQTQAICLS